MLHAFLRIPVLLLGLVGIAGVPASGLAATYVDGDTGSPGAAVSQRFLEDGASVVATPEGMSCLVSRRIEIEKSTYVDEAGTALPFDGIRRSPATSIQAVAAEGEAAPGFRIQLKFSPRRDLPVMLSIGGESIDIADRLEGSSDSLWIDGAMAKRLAAAFVAGEVIGLEARSAETGHRVTDRLPAPDLAALEACRSQLDGSGAQPGKQALPPSTEISLIFDGDAETSPLATLDELRECRMEDAPGKLRLARLASTTGFISQTDRVFVAFDPAGRMLRAYVPGIFDADFRDGVRRVLVSRAADGNVPAEANRVKGCLGDRPVELCPYDLGPGRHLIGACPEGVAGFSPNGPDVGRGGNGTPITLTSLVTPPGVGGQVPGVGGGGGGGGGSTPPGTIIDEPGNDCDEPLSLHSAEECGSDDDDDDDDDDDGGGGSEVPLPASLLLMAAALGGLSTLRRRRR